MRRSFVIVALLAAGLPIACRPDLGERDSLVTRTEVLAVRGDPPEAKPGEAVRYSLLVASPDGPITSPLTSWAYCATPKLLTENGAASAACIGSGVRPLAEGPPVLEAAMPADACSLFGPEVASADLRPRDPDITGGFYQPLRVTVFGHDETAVAFGLERIRCALANASADVTTDFGSRYVENQNPELLPLTIALDGAPIDAGAIPRGARVTLRASWPESSAERYVVYELSSRRLVDRRETMRVSWFSTAGTFANDRTGRAEHELETFTGNDWTAPSEARTVHLFVVLRDARGGVAFATHTLTTQ
ncbi:MAG: hypothetical protein K0S65_4287 [Labilithrix sp.]|nr:hypothetical protein [Labilithrix sp.]